MSMFDQPLLPSLADMPGEVSELNAFIAQYPIRGVLQQLVRERAWDYVRKIRDAPKVPLLERLLSTYSLSSNEGQVLMELAESFLRIPDTYTRDALISDKLPGRQWFGFDSQLRLLIGSALQLATKIVHPDRVGLFHDMVKRLSIPIIRQSVHAAMNMIAGQFVLAGDIVTAIQRCNSRGQIASFDMLGEAARSEDDAERYQRKYLEAIVAVGQQQPEQPIYQRHGVSVKLSALSARYETAKQADIIEVLLPRLLELVETARAHNITLTIDAEENARLDISLNIISHVLQSSLCENWVGFGLALQAYQRRAGFVLEHVIAKARCLDRKFHVRL
ncbi:MAG: proline dehydrogenase family protein, partial [Alphaproteobacteria bacterium]|nr:proline dehydrogenase family protein [Alphaproteobacteria bacterium]